MTASRACSTHCETQQAGAAQLVVMAVFSAVLMHFTWVSGSNGDDKDEEGPDASFLVLGMAATVSVSVICVLLL